MLVVVLTSASDAVMLPAQRSLESWDCAVGRRGWPQLPVSLARPGFPAAWAVQAEQRSTQATPYSTTQHKQNSSLPCFSRDQRRQIEVLYAVINF